MIVGLGTDIVSITRIRELLERKERSFLAKIFADSEILAADAKRDPAEYYASRWAAKEAAAKALGCGIGKDCGFKDVIITNDKSGRPALTFVGRGAETASRLGITETHISLSHERKFAMATVILS